MAQKFQEMWFVKTRSFGTNDERRWVVAVPDNHERTAVQEVNDFLSMLREYGLRLEDLVKNSPRSWQDRERAKRIASFLSSDPQSMVHIKEQQGLPSAAGQFTDAGDKKVMEHHFPYITGLALITSGRFPVLAGLLSTWTGGDK